jgi:hypothetical protein
LLQSVSALAEKRPAHLKRLAAGLSPLVAVSALFAFAFAAYNLKEFGNMADAYVYRQDMKKIALSSEIPMSGGKTRSMVYGSSGIATLKETREFALSFFIALGAELDESQTKIYDKTAVYVAYSKEDSEHHSLYVDYNGLSYWYSRFGFDKKPWTGADASDVREALLGFGVDVPKNAMCRELENGRYRFDAEPSGDGAEIVCGWLDCSLYEGGEIGQISNHLSEATPVKEVWAMSEQSAYERIQAGEFKPYYYSLVDSINIVAVKTEHKVDTKGFFQPVHVFLAETNLGEIEIPIPAI